VNFLGHAYIARNHPNLIAGNFAGDSYKGKIENFSNLPEDILNGIRLHRFIDDFTDSSKNVIASDILLDHHLSREWSSYSDHNYQEFVDFVYENTDAQLNELHPEFQWMYSKLKQYGWLFDYPSIPGISKIMELFSRRIGFENDLLKTVDIYQTRQTEIDQLFHDFLIEINEASAIFLLEKLQQKS